MEERALRDLESARTRLREADRRSELAEERERRLDRFEQDLEEVREARLAELETVAGMTRDRARQILIRRLKKKPPARPV